MKEILWWSAEALHLPSTSFKWDPDYKPLGQSQSLLGYVVNPLCEVDGRKVSSKRKDQRPCGFWSRLGYLAWMVLPCWQILGVIEDSKVWALPKQGPSCLSLSKGGTATMLKSLNNTIPNVEGMVPKEYWRDPSKAKRKGYLAIINNRHLLQMTMVLQIRAIIPHNES